MPREHQNCSPHSGAFRKRSLRRKPRAALRAYSSTFGPQEAGLKRASIAANQLPSDWAPRIPAGDLKPVLLSIGRPKTWGAACHLRKAGRAEPCRLRVGPELKCADPALSGK